MTGRQFALVAVSTCAVCWAALVADGVPMATATREVVGLGVVVILAAWLVLAVVLLFAIVLALSTRGDR